MEMYLMKFSACLVIFMVFYKVFLEKESMHQVKRYYLLAAIIFSTVVPFVVFTKYVEPVVIQAIEIPVKSDFYIEPEIVAEPINYWPIILWSIYGLGVLLFVSKFFVNVFKLSRKIKRSFKKKSGKFTYVLLKEKNTPHTFFNFIFLNKKQFETQQIPKEVFLHEEAHAKQKHSFDILFIEVLQIIFWFHPLVYWAKHCIKLNHEFLADEAVIKHGIEPASYQQLLLTFSSPDSHRDAEPQLANAINYSSIKKRFTVMKTQTSKQKIWLRSFLLVPLVALTLYGFSETKEVVKTPNPQTQQNPTPILTIQQNPLRLMINGKTTTLKDLKTDFDIITRGKKSDLSIKSDEAISLSFIESISELLAPNLSTILMDSKVGIVDDTPATSVEKTKSNEKNKPLLMLSNNIKTFCEHCNIDISLLENASVATLNNDVVASFKIKIPAQPSLYINGKSFNSETLKLIGALKNNESFLIFDVKTATENINGSMNVTIQNNDPKAKKPNRPSKTKEQVKLNGVSSKDGIFMMTTDELSTVELSINKGKITTFKFKVPGKKTVYIEGNTLNDDAKTLLKEIPVGHGVQLFDIKNSENAVHPPVFIEIK